MKGSKDKPEEQRPVGYEHAGIVSRVTYHFVEPLIRLGVRQQIEEGTSAGYLPNADHAETLAADFHSAYTAVQAHHPQSSPAGLLWRTYWRLYKWVMILQLSWTLAEVAVRVGSPLLLRQLLSWFVGNERYGGEDYPDGRGWMWAGLLAIMGYLYTLVHHQLFWVGMRMGFQMRLQAIAAIQAKVLRLNSVAVADVSPGKIVNLASNDVRRFDDAATFWNFLICGPLELAIVLVLVGLRLGFPAALAGVATLLLLIPTQGLLVRYIGTLRSNTATQTDERVRLTSEAIDGALAAKMMSWEEPIMSQIQGIRVREAIYIRRMARIRALNMALSFAITPIVSLITFAVARATSQELSVANVFYALALLSLPKLYVAEFFVRGIEFVSEARISIRRLGEFLQLPEPPQPVHAQQQQQQQEQQQEQGQGQGAAQQAEGGTGSDDANVAVAVRGADFDWDNRSWIQGDAGVSQASQGRGEAGGKQQQLQGAGAAAPVQNGAARLRIQVPPQPSAPAAAAGAAVAPDADPGHSAASHPTLKQLAFEGRRGQLVAIVGEVGSGKSSLLAALLGELQPIVAGTESREEAGDSEGRARQQLQGQGGEPVLLVRGTVGYCSQVPWIISGSVKENILFGLEFDRQRYEAVLSACALRDDIASLPAGDDTELGERGINLSGGQKARLALARAAFSQADVQLLDDPLSAVDPRVGRVLFSECIGPQGIMAGSTRLLVTHQRQYLPQCDAVLVMEGGRIVDRGTYAELAARGVTHVAVMHGTELDDSTYDSHTGEGDSKGEAPADMPLLLEDLPEEESPKTSAAAAAAASNGRTAAADGSGQAGQQQGGVRQQQGGVRWAGSGASSRSGGSEDGERAAAGQKGAAELDSSTRSGRLLRAVTHQLSRVFGGRSQKGSLKRVPTAGTLRRNLSTLFAGGKHGGGGSPSGAAEQAAANKSGKLVVGEDRATGSVATAVYGRYLGYMGPLTVTFISACLLGGQAAYLYGDYWLAMWASKSSQEQQKAYWVWVYAIFAGCILLVSLLRSLLFFHASLKASTAMHDAMVQRVLHAPLSFFHTNPTGRVLNRFSRDQGAVDELLPQCLFDSLQALMMVLGAFVLLMVVVPVIIPVFVPLSLGFFWVRRRYLATSREVKRFEAVTRSPVYSSLSAILKGLPTIRAYSAGSRFRAAFLSDLSKNGSWWFCFLTTARWIGFRLDMLVALLMTAAPLLMMAIHDKLEARLAGLALTQALQLSGMLQWMVRQTAEVENHMTSVERMLAYTRLDQEPPTVAQGGGRPPPGWPHGGCIEYERVTAIYRPGLPPVLKGLTFKIQGGQSCGVVGRTGSGKSSLMLTLFRLIPITGGHVLLDGVDTSTLGLDALRRQIAIIPQDPVLFSGTLRSNLDPWNKYEDARLWEVLKTVQLGAAVSGLGGLDSRMAEAGDNLSVGQRQLFCLARALLQEAAVLALDEATANVDRGTDELIQAAVRSCCEAGGANGSGRRRTLLVIAHRIDTILDCDQLLVLSKGELVESGAPADLVRSGGVFARLVAAAQQAAAAQHQHGAAGGAAGPR